ncbi:glycerophosphodiester phosphodiesterase [Acrasis kona]|uniref:Glycerophosphodiester phosphodiesterase n=1 Tax=Acrasis kona TaxID=1008807 RepID=A0AAW2YYP4_9EUKA
MILLLSLPLGIILAIYFIYHNYKLPNSTDSSFMKGKLIGHRCVHSDESNLPDNSISSAMYGLQQGLDGLEFDIMESKDNEIFIFHDPTTMSNRCIIPDGFNEKSCISNLRSSDIKKFAFKIKNGDSYPPTLPEFIKSIHTYTSSNRSKKILFIEIKDFSEHGEPKIVEQIAQFFIDHPHLYDCAVVASFSAISLYKVKKNNPKIVTSIITKKDVLRIWYSEGLFKDLFKWPLVFRMFLPLTIHILDALFYLCAMRILPSFLGVGMISFETSKDLQKDLQMVKWIQSRGYQVNTYVVNNAHHKKQLMIHKALVTTDYTRDK